MDYVRQTSQTCGTRGFCLHQSLVQLSMQIPHTLHINFYLSPQHSR